MREILIKLRKMYEKDFLNISKKLILALVILITSAVLIDTFLPFNIIFNFIRAFVLILLSISIFVLGYFISLKSHYNKMEEYENWIPYRFRYSYTFRRNISIILAAFLIVFMYGTPFSPVYTLMSSIYISCGIAIILFVRKTSKEKLYDEYGATDIRDRNFKEYYDNYKKEQELKKAEKKKGKKKDD